MTKCSNMALACFDATAKPPNQGPLCPRGKEMRVFLCCLVSFLWAFPAQAQKTSAQLLAEISTNIPSGQPNVLTAASLRQVLNDMVTAGTVELQTTATLPVFDLTLMPPNAFYASGAGAIFSTHAVVGDLARAAVYAKFTATQNSTIAEYGSIFDCNLNSGLGGGGSGQANSKVCTYTNALTSSNSGTSTWASATNLVIGAGDNATFKITSEFDITNHALDCAPLSGRNCYALYISGLVDKPITAYVNIAPPVGTLTPAAHFGLLIGGAQVADTADFEEDGGAPRGICIGCLAPTTHSAAAIQDLSTSPTGIWLSGTYSSSAIRANLPTSTLGSGGLYVCADSDGIFYKKATCP